VEARIPVRVVPRARRDELAGERDGALLVRVTAPPVEGRANAAVEKLLARSLRIAPSRVVVARGGRSPAKLVRVEGIDEAEARRRLGLPPA
jgi:uncharacterized protein YggU (UPF0235/DUF167 family)